MASDPIECRLFAARCMEVANSSTNEELKRSMSALATTWMKMADELERSQTIAAQFSSIAQRQAAKR